MTTTFTVPLLISIAGVEHETDATIVGTFQRAQPAYTPRGEYAPTEPPEPASFDVESVTVVVGGRWAGATRKDFDLMPLLTEQLMDHLCELGIEEAGNDYERGREAAAEAKNDALWRDRYLAELGE